MNTTVRKAAISNGAFARLTGLDHSMVSRLRAGLRKPSIATMSLIEEHIGWSVEAQARALANDAYPRTFEAYLVETFGAEGEDE